MLHSSIGGRKAGERGELGRLNEERVNEYQSETPISTVKKGSKRAKEAKDVGPPNGCCDLRVRK